MIKANVFYCYFCNKAAQTTTTAIPRKITMVSIDTEAKILKSMHTILMRAAREARILFGVFSIISSFKIIE